MAALMMALVPINAVSVKAQKSMLSMQDEKFMKNAVSGGMFEVKMGEFAAKQATDEKVKSFAQRMVADHSKANQELMDTAKKVGFMVPDAMDNKDQRMYDSLAKLEGSKFDSEYIKHMVKDHEKDIDEFKKEAKDGKNADVKQFAQNSIPTLEEHLRMAKEAEKK